MFAKIFLAIVVMIIVGACLLSFRTSELKAMHQMAGIHGDMVSAQKQMWNLQTKIAKQSAPTVLDKKLVKAGITEKPQRIINHE